MKIKDLKSVVYSSYGMLQMAIVYDYSAQIYVFNGTIEGAIKNYGECELTRIQADQDALVLEVLL